MNGILPIGCKYSNTYPSKTQKTKAVAFTSLASTTEQVLTNRKTTAEMQKQAKILKESELAEKVKQTKLAKALKEEQPKIEKLLKNSFKGKDRTLTAMDILSSHEELGKLGLAKRPTIKDCDPDLCGIGWIDKISSCNNNVQIIEKLGFFENEQEHLINKIIDKTFLPEEKKFARKTINKLVRYGLMEIKKMKSEVEVDTRYYTGKTQFNIVADHKYHLNFPNISLKLTQKGEKYLNAKNGTSVQA